MRIAVAIQALDTPGGKERDALAIAGGLAARGHEVTILTRSAALKLPSGAALRTAGSGGWSNHAKARNFANAVSAIRRAGEFGAILSFDKIKDADVYYAADVCFAGRQSGLTAWLPRYTTYARLEAECFGASGPDILFLCRKAEAEYRRHYDLTMDRAAVLPPMIHDLRPREFYAHRDAIRERFGIPAEAPLAVSVAVYPEQKGVDRSIAALREIPGLHLLAVGLKDTALMKSLASGQGVAERTHLSGHSDEVADILGAADLMLHPARLENTGLVILESLIAGVPVIASAACGFAEYIERFGAGTVLPEPFDAARYVAAIQTALRPDTLAECKRRSRDSAPQLLREGGIERILDAIEERLLRRQQSASLTRR